MLFDIRGRRRRVIQVIYVFLALLLGGSLVFFGIGGDAPGGLGDALGISQDGGTGNPDFDRRIEDANETLEQDPENPEALLELARFQFLAGNDAAEVDDQGVPVFTDDAQNRFEAAVDAWEQYLDTEPQMADETVGVLIQQAYDRLLGTASDLQGAQRYFAGAQETAQLVAEERPSPNSFLQLAGLSYINGNVKAGDAAAKKAVAEVDDASRKQLQQQLDQAKQQGKQIQQQLEASRSGEEGLQNPLGGLAPGEESGGVGEPGDLGVPGGSGGSINGAPGGGGAGGGAPGGGSGGG